MPWEVNIMDDGNSEVFGIHLGVTTLAQAQHIFHIYGKTAIFSQLGHEPTVETYFDSTNLGGLSATVVLNLSIPERLIRDMLDHAMESNLQPSGARRFDLHSDNIDILLDSPIKAITYIPSVRLDKEMIVNRFGVAENIQQIPGHPKTSIWHYPRLGLLITFYNKEKTVLEYRIQDRLL